LTVSADRADDEPIYVVESGGVIVGFYGLGTIDRETSELDYLFVEPAQIGRGFGRQLIEHAKRTAQALGRIKLIIQGDPHAARFYHAAGAEQVGTRPSESIPGRDLPLFELKLV
jgi:GNAT superfamily N-acetyltransferase